VRRRSSPADLELDKATFTLSDAEGPGHARTIAALLRQAADRLDGLGDVTVTQIELRLEPHRGDDRLRLSTVYRPRAPRGGTE